MQKRWLMLMLGAALAVAGAHAQAPKKGPSPELLKHAADHRAMAEAHTNAAACLEAGKPEQDCEAQLQKDCKGLGIGKYCGMKHRH
ncbi:MAG: hypothetical protein ACREUW_02410 [Burkholderiales bacterium]